MWQSQLNADPLPWLLEEDPPGVRYLALRDLMDRPADDPERIAAAQVAHRQGPIAAILDEMAEEGYWVRPGPGYNPKYRSIVWSLTMLAQLGASAELDERIERACTYLLDHALASAGRFTMSGPPSSNIDCLQGNLLVALIDLGCDDPRIETAVEWLARSITGEGIAPVEDSEADIRFYAANCGPNFACGYNGDLPCAWGAVKAMLALSRWPEERRTPLIRRAIEQGANFLFSVDPADATYPARNGKTSRNWWKFGFPVFYITDLLQNVEALLGLGYGGDPRLARSLALIRDKQDEQGRWPLEYDYTGKTWVDFGPLKQPNKWVTLRALRVLKMVG
jgi:hypothetical protein